MITRKVPGLTCPDKKTPYIKQQKTQDTFPAPSIEEGLQVNDQCIDL